MYFQYNSVRRKRFLWHHNRAVFKYELISFVLNENYYNLLLALDGEVALGGKQVCYELFDEEKNLLNACGEIEEAAFRYFMEK